MSMNFMIAAKRSLCHSMKMEEALALTVTMVFILQTNLLAGANSSSTTTDMSTPAESLIAKIK